MSASFLFYDLETFGADTRRSRIAQFAAIRTDEALEEIEDPVDFMVRPADDLLPSPGATLVTGITPQRAMRDGIAYEALTAWLRAGDFDAATLRTFRDRLYAMLDGRDDDGFRKPFAAACAEEIPCFAG